MPRGIARYHELDVTIQHHLARLIRGEICLLCQ